jgi:hypothetical protein
MNIKTLSSSKLLKLAKKSLKVSRATVRGSLEAITSHVNVTNKPVSQVRVEAERATALLLGTAEAQVVSYIEELALLKARETAGYSLSEWETTRLTELPDLVKEASASYTREAVFLALAKKASKSAKRSTKAARKEAKSQAKSI